MPVTCDISEPAISSKQLQAEAPWRKSAGGILWRLVLLIFLFSSEITLSGLWFNRNILIRQAGLTGFIGHRAGAALHVAVAFVALFLTLRLLKDTSPIFGVGTGRAKSLHSMKVRVSLSFLVAHFFTLGICYALAYCLLHAGILGLEADLVAVAWLAAGIISVLLAGCAVIPISVWVDLTRGAGWLWLISLVATLASVLFGRLVSGLWQLMAGSILPVAGLILRPFLPNLSVNLSTLTIGTPSFSVIVLSGCSGLEGIGLILVFVAVWLWLYRQEYCFPRALILFPIGAFASWLGNCMRIAALVLIGNAGAPAVSVEGFHSQAGWFAFNGIAIGLAIATRRVAWLKRSDGIDSSSRMTSNPSLPWLLPFLAILLAGMIAQAAGIGFEVLYPLRFLAAAAVLWYFRSTYKTMDWSVSWFSPLLGAVVFFLWIGLNRPGSGRSGEIQAGLASLPQIASLAWLTFRTAAAVITVPICEELAFRGFLIRRLLRSDFDSLNIRAYTWPTVLISSVLFGILHGNQWIAGTIAGLAYSGALLWRGRIGDAIIAHATTNALIVASVLVGGHWELW